MTTANRQTTLSAPPAARVALPGGSATAGDAGPFPNRRIIKAACLRYSDARQARGGDVLQDLHGVRYAVLGVTPATRGAYLTLRGRCAVCGGPFTITTRRIFAWLVRTCPAHRGQSRPISRKRAKK